MDYYQTLGVPRNASDSDLKKAYKKASMQHHPDRGGDEAKFKEINEAYSTLKDPNKRAEYDNPQPRFAQGFGPNGFGNPSAFEDIFAQAMGRGHMRPSNPDIRIRVKLSLDEILTGKKIIASYRLRNGQESSVNLDIPPGVHHGDTMKFPHLGDNSIPGPRGNLFVEIHVGHRNNWIRNGNDLKTLINVNCLELITGTKITVNTLDNKNIELTIPKGTKNGTTFSAHGYGVPDVRSGKKGKLLMTIEATIPQNLKEEQIQRIREILNNGK